MINKIEERLSRKIDILMEQPAAAPVNLDTPAPAPAPAPAAPKVPPVPDAPAEDDLGGADVSGVGGGGTTIISREGLKSELDEIERLSLQKEQKCRILAMQLPQGKEIQSALEAMADSEIEQWKVLKKFTNSGIE